MTNDKKVGALAAGWVAGGLGIVVAYERGLLHDGMTWFLVLVLVVAVVLVLAAFANAEGGLGG